MTDINDTGAQRYPHLFSGVRIDSLELANRCAVAPMTRTSAAADGIVTDQIASYYGRYARGGFGLIITEGTYTDTRYSQGYYQQPGIATDAQAAAWRPVVDAVHAAGGAIVAQLMHGGAQSQYNAYVDENAAPIARAPYGTTATIYHGNDEPYATPKAMTGTDIIEMIDGFVASAKNAMQAGFDGVELHAANGYLLDEFITDYFNTRDDEYGGALGNRLRVIRQVITAVRDAVGTEFCVGIRLSQIKVTDSDHRWASAEDAATIFSTVAAAGVSYIHVTGAGATEPAFSADGPSLAELAHEHGQVAVITNGGLHDVDAAEAQLASGGAHVVALGRGALVNADWPARMAQGRGQIDFDHEMLQPLATLDNQAQWEAARDDIFEPLDTHSA
ncbi:NADH:flavin oxidoreductase [uncultured Salinisphaera sp.]|uniref:NADH:flavin oxidoreductase n=1 Tax=uncultured Salinisphaera sp. TaxID=359372 RepID=UPI0032B2CFA4|tara:strand:+ start:18787 stop:19953 length:1167 start_codon:yes stop_codon:yes gene_type:complete